MARGQRGRAGGLEAAVIDDDKKFVAEMETKLDYVSSSDGLIIAEMLNDGLPRLCRIIRSLESQLADADRLNELVKGRHKELEAENSDMRRTDKNMVIADLQVELAMRDGRIYQLQAEIENAPWV